MMKRKEKWLEFHKKGIRTQMIVYIGILVVLPLCLGLMVLNIYLQKVMNDNKVRFDSSSLLQIKNNADQIIEVMNYSTSMMIVNRDVMENIRLLREYPDSYELYRAKTSLSTRLSDLESSVLNAVDGKLAILTSDGYLISSYNIGKTSLDYEEEAWYREILENGRKVTFQPELIRFFRSMSNHTIKEHQHLYIGRSIQDYSGRTLGIIMVQLSASKIWGKYTQALEKSGQEAFYILDGDFHRLIDYNGRDDHFLNRMSEEAAGWNLNQKHVLRGTMDGSDYYMAVLLKQSGNVLLYSVPASVYKEELSGIASGILVLIILLVLLTILTMIYFSGKLSRPLIYMVDMLEQSDNGILKLRDTKASFGEMNSLIASYNEAGERIEELIKKVKLESELKEKAHYEMLMSQISPHFIFNTVHSIQIMAQKEEGTKTARALESLGAILQAVYRSKNGMTTVGQETILLHAYVDIMQIRFGDSFHFYNTIPTELYLYEIPAFTMQPIVENAILHGVKDMKAGQIIVSAVEYPNDFVISVFDNGESADKEKMDQLLKKPNENKSAFTGIGLHQLIQWEKHGFSLLPDAADGEAALELIRKHRPDIILLDLNIPKIDGLQILRHLKEEGIDCKVIVISCNEEFDMVKEAMKLGSYDYLRKLNLSSDELLGILKKCRQELCAGSGRDEKSSSFAFHEIRYDEIMNPNGKDLFLNVGTYRTVMCILPPAEAPEGFAKKTAESAARSSAVFFLNAIFPKNFFLIFIRS